MTNPAREKAIKHYVTVRPDLEHQLDFFTKLWEAQDTFAEEATPYVAPEGDLERALRQHQTLFSLAGPEIPVDAYREAVRAMAALLAADGGLPEEQTAALTEVDLGDAVAEEALKDALTGFDVFVHAVAEAAGDERIAEPVLAFMLTEAMTPFVRSAAKAAVAAVGKFDWLQWDSGLCPVCGTPAASGVVRDEGELQGGRRWLSCPVCRTQWEYARIRCARCGTRSQQDLEYLFDEEDPAHRLHVCKKCHGYAAVSFEKDLRLIGTPEVEEIVMVRLEAVAADRGYTPLGDDEAEVPN